MDRRQFPTLITDAYSLVRSMMSQITSWALKMKDWKRQYWNLMDQVAALETDTGK